jgi:hypothetical protein
VWQRCMIGLGGALAAGIASLAMAAGLGSSVSFVARAAPPEATASVEQFGLASYRRVDAQADAKGGTPVYIVNPEIVVRATVRHAQRLDVHLTRSARETVASASGVPDASGAVEVHLHLPAAGTIYGVQGSAVASDQRPLGLGELGNERGERVRPTGVFRVMTEATPRQTPPTAAMPGVATPAGTSTPPGSSGQGSGGDQPSGTLPSGNTRFTFLAGWLRQVTAEVILIEVPGPRLDPVRVLLGPATQICRRTCQAAWSDLRVGDRLEVGMDAAPGARPIARWINANAIAGYGEVRALGQQVVTILLTRGFPGSERELSIESSTIVAAAGGTVVGQVGPLRVGDSIYFTGTAEHPDPQTRQIWALRIFQLQRPTPAASP